MSIARAFRRFRQRLADGIRPKQRAWHIKTHVAYPEIHTFDDGRWVLCFYAYEPFGWSFKGEVYATEPEFPTPSHPHPTNFPHGKAPEIAVAAWKKYYDERPQPLTLLERHEGQASNRIAAQTKARIKMRQELDKYRRTT